jgi:hypothetical protein
VFDSSSLSYLSILLRFQQCVDLQTTTLKSPPLDGVGDSSLSCGEGACVCARPRRVRFLVDMGAVGNECCQIARFALFVNVFRLLCLCIVLHFQFCSICDCALFANFALLANVGRFINGTCDVNANLRNADRLTGIITTECLNLGRIFFKKNIFFCCLSKLHKLPGYLNCINYLNKNQTNHKLSFLHVRLCKTCLGMLSMLCMETSVRDHIIDFT